jgi:hypothetical protein
MGKQNYQIALQSECGSPVLRPTCEEFFRAMGVAVRHGRKIPAGP